MSDNTVHGRIEAINTRIVNPTMTVYDVVVGGVKYGNGRRKPEFIVGDNVTFEFTKQGQFRTIKPGSMMLRNIEPKESASKGLWETLTTTTTTTEVPAPPDHSDLFNIARADAIATVAILAQHGALGITDKMKFGDRHELISGKIADLTREYFHASVDWVGTAGPPPANVNKGGDTAADEASDE